MEDNAAALTIMRTGKNPTMRHLSRTHRINIGFIHEVVQSGQVTVERCRSEDMCSDVFAKNFSNPAKWEHVTENIGHVDPEVMWGRGAGRSGPGGQSPSRSAATPGVLADGEAKAMPMPRGAAKATPGPHSEANASRPAVRRKPRLADPTPAADARAAKMCTRRCFTAARVPTVIAR